MKRLQKRRADFIKVNKALRRLHGDDIFAPEAAKTMYDKVVIRLNEERGIPPERDILEYLFLLYMMGDYKESALRGYIRVPIGDLESHTIDSILQQFPIFQLKTMEGKEYLSVPIQVYTWNKWIKR